MLVKKRRTLSGPPQLSPSCLIITKNNKRFFPTSSQSLMLRRARFTTPHDFLKDKKKRKTEGLRFLVWSGKRGSNSRPQPWQGCALPAELHSHVWFIIKQNYGFSKEKSALSAIFSINAATPLSSGIVGERGTLKNILRSPYFAKDCPNSNASF